MFDWLLKRLPCETIWGVDKNGVPTKYMTRYFIFGSLLGKWFPNAKWGLRLNHFHRPDADTEFHNHPWAWAHSLIISGSYVEMRTDPFETRDDLGIVRIRFHKRWEWNHLTHMTYHRVMSIEENTWTLFITGPKVGSWEFWNLDTGKHTPWREFVAARDRVPIPVTADIIAVGEDMMYKN